MFSTGRATDFTPQAPCLMTRRRDASGRAAKGASRRSCKRLSTGRRFGTRHSEGAGDAVTMFSAFSASSCPPRPPGRKPPAAGLFEGSAAKVLTPGISISEGQSRVRDNSNHDGRGGKPRSCVRPPGDNRRQGGRGQGSGVRGQGSGIRGQGSGIRGQGSGIRDQGGSASSLPFVIPLWKRGIEGDFPGIVKSPPTPLLLKGGKWSSAFSS
jgi:hypothetical protein